MAVLGTAIVVIVFVLWWTRPWRGGMRRLAKRRARVQDWGAPLGEPPAGAEEEAVTLRGRLEADGPILHLAGPEAAIATLHGSPTGAGHLAAEGLRLRLGEAVIPIEGRVEVLVGAHEEHPKSVPEKTEYRFAESKLGKVERLEDPPKRAQLRRIPRDAEVIVRGHLERRATDGSQYREGAHGWALVTGKHGEPIELAAVTPKAVRVPAGDWALRALGLGFLVFVLVPLGLEHGGEALADHGNEVLRDCDGSGHSWLAAADWAGRIEGAFPGFGDAGLDQRRDAVGLAVNGVRVCDMDESPAGWVDTLIPVARERLPALEGHEYFDSTRNRLEETLHEAGLDRAIVELQADLPRGGEVTERVRAHLYLGDLEGALATWAEPGAEMAKVSEGVLQKGPLLCAAGRTEEALPAFDALLEAMAEHESDLWRRSALFRDGLCALRAGDVARAERRAVELGEQDYATIEIELLRARVAAERGELLEWTDRELQEPAALLVAVALAEAERWEELLAWMEDSRLDHPLGSRIRQTRSALYNEIFFPELNTEQLSALAAALEGAAAELATVAPEPEGEAEALPGIAGPMNRALEARERSEMALHRAGELHHYLALLYGRRWDPRAEAELDEAERLLGAEAVAPLKEALAFFHGDWERSRELDDQTMRNLSRIYLGEEPDRGFQVEVRQGHPLGLTLLHPNHWEAEHAIAALYRDEDLSDELRWRRMRAQTLRGSWAVLFYRLTHVIVHGENLGFDVSGQRAQLEGLRALFESQPDPHLLVGAHSDAEL